MAGGTPDGVLLEFEKGRGTGVWVDVSSYISGRNALEYNIGRQTEYDDGQPSTFTMVLRNPDGAWTPDNASSPFWPYVVEGNRFRFTITDSATAYRQGTWTVREWNVQLGTIFEQSTVSVTGIGRMGVTGRRQFLTDLAEYVLHLALTAGTAVDVYPLFNPGGGSSPRVIKNYGNSGNLTIDPEDDPAVLDGGVLFPAAAKGVASFTSADGLLYGDAIELSPNDTAGPIIQLQNLPSPEVMGFEFKTSDTPVAGSDTYLCVAAGYDSDGDEIWGIRLHAMPSPSKKTFLEMWINGAYAYTMDQNPSDGGWHSVLFIEGGHAGSGSCTLYYDTWTTNGYAAGAPGLELSDTTYWVLGGQHPRLPRNSVEAAIITNNPVGKQTFCVNATYGHPFALRTFNFGGFEAFIWPNNSATLLTRWGQFIAWSGVTSWTITGDQSQLTLDYKDSTGRSAMDCMLEVARSIGGVLWERPSDDRLELLTAEQIRPQTAAFTISLGTDDDGTVTQTWARGATENPTRLTVTCPDGQTTWVDTDAELIERRDGPTLDTMLPTLRDARSLAAWYVRRRKYLRLKQIAVDAVTAGSDLWASLLALTPGTRITVTGLNGTVLPWTQVDVRVIGWNVQHQLGSSRWTLYTEMADGPGDITFDDDIYSRLDFDFDDATLTAGISSSATSFSITTTLTPLSVTAGDYPLYLAIGIEDILIPAAPASATSPQTVTGVTRGARGTVAVAHATGAYVRTTPDAGLTL